METGWYVSVVLSCCPVDIADDIAGDMLDVVDVVNGMAADVVAICCTLGFFDPCVDWVACFPFLRLKNYHFLLLYNFYDV